MKDTHYALILLLNIFAAFVGAISYEAGFIPGVIYGTTIMVVSLIWLIIIHTKEEAKN
jgi:hypothetical protein